MSDSVSFLGFPKGFEMSSVPSFVVVNCPFCKKTAQIEVVAEEFEDWQAGELIQNAMPNLDADSREQLISGTCPKCWDEMFGDPCRLILQRRDVWRRRRSDFDFDDDGDDEYEDQDW